MNPDDFVNANGEEVSVEYVSDAQFDTDYQFDEVNSTLKKFTTTVVLSNPSDRVFRRLEGRGAKPELVATVTADANIEADREGREDHITARGDTYKVVEVRSDKHPVTGWEKKTVVLEGLMGR